MSLRIWNRFCFVLGVLAIMAFAAGAHAQVEKPAKAACSPLFGSKVCTSYQMKDGKITELVLRVPVAVVENAPANPTMVWPPHPDLNIPFGPVVKKQTGFTFASIWWEAHGHPPAAFMVPHFDLHFYFAPEKKIAIIDCKDTVKPKVLPAGYVLPDLTDPHIGKMVGACVPDMGMHALPATDLAQKTGWKASMMIGYYGGQPKFFEPMISNALLLQKHSFTLPVPQDIQPVAHVRYPKRFRAVYLAKAKAYDFTFFY
jgi:hypothetical protein